MRWIPFDITVIGGGEVATRPAEYRIDGATVEVRASRGSNCPHCGLTWRACGDALVEGWVTERPSDPANGATGHTAASGVNPDPTTEGRNPT